MSIMDFQFRYFFEHSYLPKILSGRGAKVELIEIEMLQGYKLVMLTNTNARIFFILLLLIICGSGILPVQVWLNYKAKWQKPQ